MDFILQIVEFLKELWNIVIVIDKWIYDLAYKIYSIDVENTVSYPLGIFRNLVGDTAYTVFVTSLYFGLALFILKLVRFVTDYMKSFNPLS